MEIEFKEHRSIYFSLIYDNITILVESIIFNLIKGRIENIYEFMDIGMNWNKQCILFLCHKYHNFNFKENFFTTLIVYCAPDVKVSKKNRYC